MKRKFNIFAVLLLAMTLIFGSMLCYAAEGEEADCAAAVEESRKVTRTINEQTASITRNVRLGSTGASIDVCLEYAWDEGLSGWFTGARHTMTHVPSDVSLIIWSLNFSGIGGSYISVTVDYTANGSRASASEQFYVDEYGDVY